MEKKTTQDSHGFSYPASFGPNTGRVGVKSLRQESPEGKEDLMKESTSNQSGLSGDLSTP